MKAKLGVNSYVVREISKNGISIDNLPIDVIELGFDDIPVLTEDGINWEMLHNLATLDVDFTIHAPCADGKNVSVDLGINTRRNIRIMENVFVIAQTLNAKYVVVHGGDIGESYHRAFINTRIQLMELATIAEEYGVELVIENMCDNRIGAFPHEMLPFIEQNVSVCIDIGHAFLTSLKYGINIREYSLLPRIVHLHLHDNYGVRDDHLPPGEGKIPLSLYHHLLLLKPRNVIIEIRNYDTPESILRGISFIKGLRPVTLKSFQKMRMLER